MSTKSIQGYAWEVLAIVVIIIDTLAIEYIYRAGAPLATVFFWWFAIPASIAAIVTASLPRSMQRYRTIFLAWKPLTGLLFASIIATLCWQASIFLGSAELTVLVSLIGTPLAFLIGFFVWHERYAWQKWVAVCVMLLGSAAFFITPQLTFSWVALLAAVAAAGYAAMAFFQKLLIDGTCPWCVMTLRAAVISSCGAAALFFSSHTFFHPSITLPVAAALLVGSICGVIMHKAFLSYALHTLSLGQHAVMGLLGIMVRALSLALVFGTTLASYQIVAAAVLFAAGFVAIGYRAVR